MAIGLVVAVNGQSWIQMATGSTVPEMVYFIVVSITMVIVARLSTRRLLALAEADQKQKMAQKAPTFDRAALDRVRQTGGEFRLPRSRFLLTFGLATIFVGGSLSSPNALWPVHVVLWGCAFGIIVFGIHELMYRVYVRGNTVRVKAFGEQQFQLSDIAQVDLVTYRGQRTANVKLGNGKIVQFSDPLKGMSLLIAVLESDSKP